MVAGSSPVSVAIIKPNKNKVQTVFGLNLVLFLVESVHDLYMIFFNCSKLGPQSQSSDHIQFLKVTFPLSDQSESISASNKPSIDRF